MYKQLFIAFALSISILSAVAGSPFEALPDDLKMHIINHVMTDYYRIERIGKDIRALASTGRTFYNFLNDPKVVSLIIKNDPSRKSNEANQRFMAIHLGIKGSMEWFTEYFQNVANLKNHGDSSLMSAAYAGNCRAIEVLTSKGISANTKSVGETALMAACTSGRVKAVETLLNAGALVNFQNHRGKTALHSAAFYNNPIDNSLKNNPSIAETLLRAGANPNVQDKEGRTPLMLSAMGYSTDTVKMLLQWEADPNQQDEIMHDTALVHAVKNSDLPTIKALIEGGADPRIRNALGLAELLCNEDRDEIIKLLERP